MAHTGLDRLRQAHLLIPGVLLLCSLSSCGGADTHTGLAAVRAGAPPAAADTAALTVPQSELFPAPASDTPAPEQLQAQLAAELDRLGIDPDRAGSQAALGNDNAVFDLVVSYYDLRQGAVLHWTERLVGDYDMNGLVNAADLTPIAQRWKYSVDYRPVAEAGGVTWWPKGNPRDGGLSAVIDGHPGFNTPADQWRTARVDGDDNGVVDLPDITPIAQHWQQSLDAYRVYRRAPAETEFSLLQPDAELPYSLPRSAQFPPDSSRPNGNYAYRLHFADLDIAAGTYEYYIAPYDSTTATQGPASPVVSIEFELDPDLPLPEIPGNKPPIASMIVNPRTGDLPLTVNFDASQSHDPDGEIVLYLWDWEGDGQVDQSGSNIPLATHIYTEPGYYRPRLTLWDDAGASATLYAPIDLEVSEDGWLPPRILSLGADVTAGRRPLTVHFLPEIEVPSGTAGLQFEWDWDGDGVVDSTEAALDDGKDYTDDWVEHVYELPLPHITILRITDNKGKSATASQQIDVLPNFDPVAILEADKTTGKADFTVQFDASQSYDPDGDQFSIAWRATEEESYKQLSGTKVSYKYTIPGDYLAGIRLTGDNGVEVFANQLIKVTGTVNIPPIAVLAADHYMEKAPCNISFNGTDSNDSDGQITKYVWNLTGDEEVYDWNTSGSWIWRFNNPGNFTVTLTVTDDRHAASSDSVNIQIIEKIPPVAQLSASPDSGNLPLSVEFDGSGSHDPADLPLDFYWKFDYLPGDEANWPYLWEQGLELAGHLYPTGGQHVCALMVRDTHNLYSIASVVVSISGTGWYLQNLDRASATAFPALSLREVDGCPAIAYTAAPYKTSGSVHNAAVRFMRAIDGQGLGWLPPVELESKGLTGFEGSAPVLRIADGRPALAWSRSDGSMVFCLATQSDGSIWQPVVSVFSGGNWNALVRMQTVDANPALVFYDAANQLRYVRADDATGASWPASQVLQMIGNHVNLFAPTFGKSATGPLIAYQNVNWPELDYLSLQATDSVGDSWDVPAQQAHCGSLIPACALGNVGGQPMLAYVVSGGLEFRLAGDAAASSWNDPVFLPDLNLSGLDPLQNQLSIVDFAGRPLILDPRMQLRYADDAAGSSWTVAEALPIENSAWAFDLAVIDGHPAIAFQDEQHLYFAIKLP